MVNKGFAGTNEKFAHTSALCLMILMAGQPYVCAEVQRSSGDHIVASQCKGSISKQDVLLDAINHSEHERAQQ